MIHSSSFMIHSLHSSCAFDEPRELVILSPLHWLSFGILAQAHFSCNQHSNFTYWITYPAPERCHCTISVNHFTCLCFSSSKLLIVPQRSRLRQGRLNRSVFNCSLDGSHTSSKAPAVKSLLTFLEHNEKKEGTKETCVRQLEAQHPTQAGFKKRCMTEITSHLCNKSHQLSFSTARNVNNWIAESVALRSLCLIRVLRQILFSNCLIDVCPWIKVK